MESEKPSTVCVHVDICVNIYKWYYLRTETSNLTRFNSIELPRTFQHGVIGAQFNQLLELSWVQPNAWCAQSWGVFCTWILHHSLQLWPPALPCHFWESRQNAQSVGQCCCPWGCLKFQCSKALTQVASLSIEALEHGLDAAPPLTARLWHLAPSYFESVLQPATVAVRCFWQSFSTLFLCNGAQVQPFCIFPLHFFKGKRLIPSTYTSTFRDLSFLRIFQQTRPIKNDAQQI